MDCDIKGYGANARTVFQQHYQSFYYYKDLGHSMVILLDGVWVICIYSYMVEVALHPLYILELAPSDALISASYVDVFLSTPSWYKEVRRKMARKLSNHLDTMSMDELPKVRKVVKALQHLTKPVVGTHLHPKYSIPHKTPQFYYDYLYTCYRNKESRKDFLKQLKREVEQWTKKKGAK